MVNLKSEIKKGSVKVNIYSILPLTIVATSWKYHDLSKIIPGDQDFKRLNKSAIKGRATTSHVYLLPLTRF